MADLATLGFAVDSGPLAKAAQAMRDMVPAAKGAQTAVDGLNTATAKYQGPVGAIAASAKRAGISVDEMKARIAAAGQTLHGQSDTTARLAAEYDRLSKTQRQLNATADITATGASRAGKAMQGLSFDARNLSFQLVDVAQGLAMGQSPMMIFAQQAGQIGQIAATSEKGIKGLFAEIGSGIAKVLTPMRLLTLGIAGVGIGLIALIKNAVDSSKAMDDLAKSINTTRSLLHGLEQVAGGRGINTDEFAAGMKSFGDQVYLAKRNMGDLVGLFRANGIGPVKDLQDAMQKVANLVARAKDDQQAQKLLVEAGLPANEQWVRYMRDLSRGIDDATAGTIKFNDAAEENMIAKAREFDKAWDTTVTKLVNGFKAAAVTIGDALTKIVVPDWLKTLLSLGATVATAVMTMGLGPVGAAVSAGATATKNYMASGDSFSARFGAAGPNPANDNSALQKGLDQWAKNWRNGFVPEPGAAGANKPPTSPVTREEQMNRIMRSQQQISLLGDMATVEDQVKSKELELAAAFLQTGVGLGKYKDAVLNAVRAQAEMSRVQQQVSIGVFNLDAANKAAADTLQMWIDKKLLDPNNAQQMAAAMNVLSRNTREMADAASVAGSNLPQLQQALNDASNVNKQIDQFATSSFSSITTGLADIFDGTKTAAQGFADLGKTVLRSLEEMLIKMYIVMPIFNALKGVLGGGGLLGSILPGVGGVAAAVHHAGGVAGGSNVTRMVDPAVFIGAHRYHSGGTAGLAPDEVPAILQRGERITPRGAGNDNTPIINIVGGGINPNDVEVRQTEDGRGNTRTDIVLDQAVANAMSRAGSSTRKAMANNYGARPVGVRR